MSRVKILIAAYAFGLVVTYGHAYQFNANYIVTFSGARREADSVERGFVALASCAVWPLYWSQHFWSKP